MSRRKNLRNNQGMTPIDLVSITIIVVSIVGVTWSWYSGRSIQSKTRETETMLQKIFDAQVSYYKRSQPAAIPGGDENSKPAFQKNKKTFLPLSPKPGIPGPDPQYGEFSEGDWSLLNLSFKKPVYYSYSVETSGEGEEATFSVIARGDLDGDHKYSRYEMVGRVDSNEKITGRDKIYTLDPLE